MRKLSFCIIDKYLPAELSGEAFIEFVPGVEPGVLEASATDTAIIYG